ncbi:hypothetical protein HN018_01560 [Lichenicola cladoniae]|uniref:Uncharacterized protein n=1 Tax=Lichenicola cladoniae TaxID=1484109 RepID=A0A6M8HHR9_9PROT|nr:hypothetical protein [Lichenicola cladoniae]NPD68621.1 hypothetical protein [Acetobacteraceae bacterium]QKE88909.1 hypothetical protein HN018_01560 [Lichenicola cladoniae]
MKSATFFAAIAFTALVGGTYAQTANAQTAGAGTNTTGTTATGATTNGAAGTDATTGTAATDAPASGMSNNMTDHNQAVATTGASTAMPAKGANSFTKKQAGHRIMKHGFTQVKDLTKDDNGVWHGTAMHDGAAVKVWEDYKGSVGTE